MPAPDDGDLPLARRARDRRQRRSLAMLWIGELLAAIALGSFEEDLLPVLALFVPLLVWRRAGSGSEASPMARATALGEVRARDRWRMHRRGLVTGLARGVLLGACASVRVLLRGTTGGRAEHWGSIGITAAFSVVGCALWWPARGFVAAARPPYARRRSLERVRAACCAARARQRAAADGGGSAQRVSTTTSGGGGAPPRSIASL